MQPHVCPVCRGTQTVPEKFYVPPTDGNTIQVTEVRESCRSCDASGVVWEPEFVVETIAESDSEYQV